LDTYRKWLTVATLRALNVEGIPDNVKAEPLNRMSKGNITCGHSPIYSELVLRVLYRLRTVSEQAPLDASTFSWFSPLLTQVLLKGAIALAEDDDPLEQMVLVLDVIKFHSGECTYLFSSTSMHDV
jgi:hypothetical protein